MKGFAANLTATRLEEMLAFYMTPEAGSQNETNDSGREEMASSDTTVDHTGKRASKAAALTEN